MYILLGIIVESYLVVGADVTKTPSGGLPPKPVATPARVAMGVAPSQQNMTAKKSPPAISPIKSPNTKKPKMVKAEVPVQAIPETVPQVQWVKKTKLKINQTIWLNWAPVSF